QIIADLEVAALLVPSVPTHVFRPSKPAAYGLLAKTYLQMADYQRALHYADLYLGTNNELMDFNTLDKSADFSFSVDYGASNPEVIFYCYQTMPVILSRGTNIHIDTPLLASYEATDLRKITYFR